MSFRPSTRDRRSQFRREGDPTGLILTGLINSGITQRPGQEEDHQNFEFDFQPPVPQTTATLLSLAEAKIKAISNTRKRSKVVVDGKKTEEPAGSNLHSIAETNLVESKASKLRKSKAAVEKKKVANKVKE